MIIQSSITVSAEFHFADFFIIACLFEIRSIALIKENLGLQQRPSRIAALRRTPAAAVRLQGQATVRQPKKKRSLKDDGFYQLCAQGKPHVGPHRGSTSVCRSTMGRRYPQSRPTRPPRSVSGVSGALRHTRSRETGGRMLLSTQAGSSAASKRPSR